MPIVSPSICQSLLVLSCVIVPIFVEESVCVKAASEPISA